MNQIRVSEKGVGECIIKCKDKISPANEFIIKSMACIQMLCISRNNLNDPKLKDLINILDNSMHQINELYNVELGDNNESNPFTDYDN